VRLCEAPGAFANALYLRADMRLPAMRFTRRRFFALSFARKRFVRERLRFFRLRGECRYMSFSSNQLKAADFRSRLASGGL